MRWAACLSFRAPASYKQRVWALSNVFFLFQTVIPMGAALQRVQPSASSRTLRVLRQLSKEKWLTSMPSSHLFLHLACCLFSILCTSTVVSGAFPPPAHLGIENGLYIGFIQPAVCVRIRDGPWSQRAATAGCLLSGHHKEYFDKDRGLRIGHVLPGMPLPTREWHSPSPSPQVWVGCPTLLCSAPLFPEGSSACPCPAVRITLLTLRTWRSLQVLGGLSLPKNVLLSTAPTSYPKKAHFFKLLRMSLLSCSALQNCDPVTMQTFPPFCWYMAKNITRVQITTPSIVYPSTVAAGHRGKEFVKI